MNFDDMAQRLFALSFDPYNCVELRWGDAASPACPDGAAKRRWYAAEAPMRAGIGRDEGGGENAGPQDADIRGLIADMPARTPFVQRIP